MKSIATIFFCLVIYTQTQAQWSGSPNVTQAGYASIGTAATDAKLTVSSPNTTTPVLSLSATGTVANLRMGVETNYAWMQSYGGLPLRINNIGNDVYFNLGGGKVGVGTASPDAKFTVTESAPGAIFSMNASGANAYFKMGLAADYAWLQSYGPRPLRINDSGNDVLFNVGGGNVGIGTATTDAKLTVKGVIHAQEVKVDLSVPGPDYVFETNYKLLSLVDLNKYIQENKHLPEIPSAKEMEEQGVNVSEMNMLLLKKVEELTLYVIELEKKVSAMEKQGK
ncbi:hypothetical protein SAMN04488109_2131 [Chryseolinea serpens]|uniref:Chaperone of endosialidase n=1 Tax=Chryseolinea serpens TaxID=947013 RepID=A0A1M5N6K0_9BACT|nr:tail fiber protein [Chryseolinea serpens]SHG85095.1 hypothetical protein SAMN04488109_2131 [Chryseolinea serpens]